MTNAAKPLLAYAMKPLERFFADPTTQEFAVNAPGEGWWRRGQGWDRVEVPELDYQMLEGLAVLSGALYGRDVGWWNPLLATDIPAPNGTLLRMQVCMPPAVPAETVSITWRRPGEEAFDLDAMSSRYRMDGWNQYAERHTARRGVAAEVLALFDGGNAPGFLAAAVRHKLNIWMCAATGGGKTEVFKSLLRAVPLSERIITVEDSLELVVPQPNNVRLIYSHGSTSEGAVTAEDLIVAALRMRPDRVPVQEIRTPEAAWVYLNGAMTGHPGSPTTIHGRNPGEAFRRFFTLCKSTPGGGSMSDDHLASMIADAVDVVVPLRNEGGEFWLREVWFKDDAMRRGEPAPRLLTEA
jgi:type IV secretion system protein VirB11